jgi:hypothetical protein
MKVGFTHSYLAQARSLLTERQLIDVDGLHPLLGGAIDVKKLAKGVWVLV